MRGDLSLRLHLFLRPAGILGLVAAVSGGAAVAAAYLPWYRVTATMEVLGTTQDTAVAHLAGWQAHPWGWVVAALGLAAVAAGIGVAIDRPLPGPILLASGFGLGIAVALGGLLFPPVSRFDMAGSRLRELVDLSGRLPDDLSLWFEVRPAAGLWVALAAGVLLLVTAIIVRDRL